MGAKVVKTRPLLPIIELNLKKKKSKRKHWQAKGMCKCGSITTMYRIIDALRNIVKMGRGTEGLQSG